MFVKTQHAAINVTVGETPLHYDFAPYPGEEGWYWGEVADEAGLVLLGAGDFWALGADPTHQPEVVPDPLPEPVMEPEPTGQEVHVTESVDAVQDEPKNKKKK